jgi:hypothetical protein
LAREVRDRQVQSREYKEVMKEKAKVESRLARLLLKQEKEERKVEKKRKERQQNREGVEAECGKLQEQLAAAQGGKEKDEERCGEIRSESLKCKKELRRMEAKAAREQETARKKQEELRQQIGEKKRELDEVEEKLLQTVREESRLQALIEEQYYRMDARRKAFMDAIRLSCRNTFYCLLDVFRPMYDNYRDDHVVLRELTRSMGIVEKRQGHVIVQLLPAMEFAPKMRQIIEEFLRVISERINRYFAGRYLPIQIELAANQRQVLVQRAKE